MTEPNAFAARFHDRLPLALSNDEAEAWLGDEPLPNADLADLCRGLPAEALLAHELPPPLKIVLPAQEAARNEGPLLL